MKLNKSSPCTEVAMDMTPMIDCVFQLLIFFMLITDMSQAALEDLELPAAMTCVPDKPDPKEYRPILNISPEGVMKVSRVVYYDPEADDGYRKILGWLELTAQRMKRKYDTTLNIELPDEPVLIRSDQNTPFKYVQKVMEQCGKETIRIWKLQLAAKVPDPNET